MYNNLSDNLRLLKSSRPKKLQTALLVIPFVSL
uniref:Uncharacterized protein n=1 Tax=Anguilla anguilla TaxID=7936 RepID=A0A0E9Q1U0_ANGAN